jgi:hypothetical protein
MRYGSSYSPGFEIISKSNYTFDSSSNQGHANGNEIPQYASMFYSPTEHEIFSQIKYGNFEQDYSNIREIQRSLNGPDLEFYVPGPVNYPDGVGRQIDQIDNLGEIMKNPIVASQEEARKEIEQAQSRVISRRITIEEEEVLIFKKKRRISIDEIRKY